MHALGMARYLPQPLITLPANPQRLMRNRPAWCGPW